MRGVSKFCKQPFERTESVRTIAPFWGGGVKSTVFYSTTQTVAIMPFKQTVLIKSVKKYKLST